MTILPNATSPTASPASPAVPATALDVDLAAGDDVGIIMVNGAPGNSTAIDREAGFEDTINEQCPNVEILQRETGNWNKDESQLAASEMITAVGAENMDIKVVLHGNGVGLLKHARTNQQLQMDVTSLKSQNVGFNVCNNTLVGRNINRETDLFDVWEEDIVPSGVAELSRLQQMGYTYIKP
mgnify:CR=1 FL=1